MYQKIENRIFDELQQYKTKDDSIFIPLNIPITITDVPKEDVAYILQADNPVEASDKIRQGYLEEFYLSDDFSFDLQENIVSQYLSQETLFLIHKHKFDMADFISNYINYDYNINNITLEINSNSKEEQVKSKKIHNHNEFASKLFGYFVLQGILKASDTDMYFDIRDDVYNQEAKEWLVGISITDETKPFFKYLYESNPAFKDENIWIVVYKDTLNYQDDKDNLTQIAVPTKWLLDYLWDKNILPDEWIEEYTADDTDTIVGKAIEEGIILDCTEKNIDISKFWKTTDVQKNSLSLKIQKAEATKLKQCDKEISSMDKSNDIDHL